MDAHALVVNGDGAVVRDGEHLLIERGPGEAHAAGEPRPRDPQEVAAVHWVSPTVARAREDVPPDTEGYIERLEAYRR